MLQQPKRPPIPLFNLEKEVALSNEKQQSDLVQQYLQKTNGNNANCLLMIYLRNTLHEYFIYILLIN